MASQQFIIRIENNTGGGKAGDKVGGAGGISNMNKTNQSQSSSKKTTAYGAKDIAKQAGAQLTVLAAYGTVRKITDEIVSHNNSLIYIKTGSRELQERTTYYYNTDMAFLDSAVLGAVAGSKFGFAGAAIGAVLGLMKQGISMSINEMKNKDTISKSRQLEDIQRDIRAQRATISGSRYMNASQM